MLNSSFGDFKVLNGWKMTYNSSAFTEQRMKNLWNKGKIEIEIVLCVTIKNTVIWLWWIFIIRNWDNHEYPHISDLKRLCSLLMYSPTLFSWFTLNCLSPSLKAWLPYCFPHNNKLNQMFVNTEDLHDCNLFILSAGTSWLLKWDYLIICFDWKKKCILSVMQYKYVFTKKCKVKLIPVSLRAILLCIFKFWEYFLWGYRCQSTMLDGTIPTWNVHIDPCLSQIIIVCFRICFFVVGCVCVHLI